ncbi:DUF805 domain-containing protein [Clavibacter michiganensis]|uniref:DUF805 domain-containing protein n=1 Tax=Clavibacter michiganensis TaxID=28447 RepID=A0A2S5VQH6_9MICO|nr:DUF805 domain-containing protein [Clavibacter michiganensis]PPF65152.1 DUF805 domain-containing protein [Clavibacter michiganensis]
MTDATPPAARPPLELPHYGAPWSEAMRRFFLKYATFRGRASRSEFWWWILTGFVVTTALDTLSTLNTGGRDPMDIAGRFDIVDPWSAVNSILQLAVFIPSLAVSWRRLHDIDRSGAWSFFFLVPLAGPIVYVIMTASGPRPTGARFD